MGLLKQIVFVSAATVAAGMIAAASSKNSPKVVSKAKSKAKAAASDVSAKAKAPRKRKSAAKRTSSKTAA